MARDLPAPYRLPLLILGFLSLGVGVGAGLLRLGWDFPLPSPELAALHGALMVCGFFGTVISLERAVALQDARAYAGPLLAGLGSLTAIAGLADIGALLLTAGSLVLLGGSLHIYRRQREIFTLTIALGAACWVAGNLLWLTGAPLDATVLFWASFLVLTIAGERLELSRFLPPSPGAKRYFSLGVIALGAGLGLTLFDAALGRALYALALIGLVAWLGRYDIARRTVHSTGLTRFIAVCLLSGYAWLGIGAIVGLIPDSLAPGARDVFLHALLLGFVFSMVFGHAPIIFPAVTRFAIPYHPAFYIHLALLHLSLLLRLVADLGGLWELRQLSGALSAVAIVVFVLNTVSAVVRGRLAARRVGAASRPR